MVKIRVIKLGGSLIEHGRAIIRNLRDYAVANNLRLVIVPGGGPFAMAVRALADKLSDEAAHWMAVLAMHQYGLFLANGNAEFPLIETLDDVIEDSDGGVSILLPYKILKDDDRLPHTWDVTSDTIAAFIAYKLGERCFIKLTNVDGILDAEGRVIERVDIEEVVKRSKDNCIDDALPGFLSEHNMYCIIVNGRYPQRVKAILAGKNTCCTKLC
ncbi:MAG: hypothetical protein J7I99_00265 [Methanophagales archaeon]|nr:hypothetical protein [Methanophagales archaeon]